MWKSHLRSRQSLARGSQASDFEGGMTVSGPSRSRMTRRLDTGEFSDRTVSQLRSVPAGVYSLVRRPGIACRSGYLWKTSTRQKNTAVSKNSMPR